MENIVIASGKGGTGKTTVAVNLAYYLAVYAKKEVKLLDCDVDAPNANLFINATFTECKDVKVIRPTWSADKCIACGKCVSVCSYNALAKVQDKILIFDELCHSCGACIYFCPQKALKAEEKTIGKIELAESHKPFKFGHGILNIGETLAPIVIKHLKNHMDKAAINLIDSAPGTSCPVVTAMAEMDYCLLVTEPTPFGLNDLTLAVQLTAKLNLPTGIIINRSYGADELIENFAQIHHIPIVGKIPFNKKYAESYSRGEIIINRHAELIDIFATIYNNIKDIQKVPQINEKNFQSFNNDENVFLSQNNHADDLGYQDLVVISGKGGTGKTTVTAALAELIENKILADSDVDAANLHLLCQPEILYSQNFVSGKVYTIDQEKCVSCGLCANFCHFGAIKNVMANSHNSYVIDELACEGCGFCFKLCAAQAIAGKDAISGKWYISKTNQGYLSHAKLGIGSENSGKLVNVVRNNAIKLATKHKTENILTDGPPGTGCPVISAITGADIALVVTEPTIAGIHDLKRALALTSHFNIPTLIIVNKFDLNVEMTATIEDLAKEYDLKIIGKIPFDKNVNTALMDGQSIITYGTGEAFGAVLAMWESLKTELHGLQKRRNQKIANENL